MRARRLLLGALFLVFLTTITPASRFAEPAAPATVPLRAEPVALDPADPERRRAGALHFLAGWSLAAPDRRFGAISAMHVEDGQVLAFTDAGAVLHFAVPGMGPARVRIDNLPAGPGTGERKSDRDAESVWMDGRRLWVAFESRNQIWRYRLPGLVPEAAAAPGAMKDWRGQFGAEATVRLADGRFLVLSEGSAPRGGANIALLFDGDPALPGTPAAALRYRPPQGYRITDAVRLPDGRLLFLNRRLSLPGGFSAKLALVDAAAVRPGALLEGREIAALSPPLAVDNMEALAVTREAGRTIVWIASDDNFGPLQRTLFLKFALAEQP